MDRSQVPVIMPSLLRAAAADSPQVEAVVDGDLRLTYAQLEARVAEFARGLVAAGVQPGEAVALWAPNSASWIISALGTLTAGAVLVPVNTRYKGSEARFLLTRSRAVLLVVDNGFLGNGYLAMLRESGGATDPGTERERAADGALLPGLPALRTVVTLRPDPDPAAAPLSEFLARGTSVEPAEVDRRVAALTGETLCDLLFTSGTSGTPKGVMTSHQTGVLAAEAWADGVGLRAGDRYLIINPLFHSFGYRAGLFASVTKRATMYPMAVFDAEEALRIIQADRISVLPGAPTLYQSILDDPRFPDFDLSALRVVIIGAATVPEELFYRIRRELPGVASAQSPYGLTEVTGTATTCPLDASVQKMSSTCGKALPGTEVAIFGADGQPLPAGENGEVRVRGYNVMLGYFEDPEATAEAIDAAGWLHTGDVGYLDEEGFLVITGRLKEVFQAGGFNVYPVEVEQLLNSHPMIAEAAVIGVPDGRLGEVAHAFVVPRPGCTPDPQEVIAYARARIANFKVPRGVTVVADLPRTPLGKVQKFRLTVRKNDA